MFINLLSKTCPFVNNLTISGILSNFEKYVEDINRPYLQPDRRTDTVQSILHDLKRICLEHLTSFQLSTSKYINVSSGAIITQINR